MIDIKVPPLGDSITEATIARWTKNEGDAVAVGETIVELETDKINVEVPAQKAGVLAKRLRNEGDVVKVDELLAQLDDGAQGAGTAAQSAERSAQSGGTAAQGKAQSAEPKAQETAASPPAPGALRPAPDQQRVAPSAQRMADEQNIPLAGITGTGRGGVVSKPDVIEQSAGQGAQSAEPRVQSAAPPAPGALALRPLTAKRAKR